MSVSMGINTIEHDHDSDHAQFFKQADSALYYAKKQGRNCIALATDN